MGALIQTKGTQRLIKQLNTAFSKGQMVTTKAAIANDAALSGLFSTPSGTAPIIQAICKNKTGAKLFLLPVDKTNHKNLLVRWDFYLGNELSNGNHELIRGFIWSVINGPNGLQGDNATNGDGFTYAAIRFDCVEGTNQTVLQSDEYKLKGTTDVALSSATAYSKIVLVTAPTTSPTPRDNQF
jgi:hypothetical protein